MRAGVSRLVVWGRVGRVGRVRRAKGLLFWESVGFEEWNARIWGRTFVGIGVGVAGVAVGGVRGGGDVWFGGGPRSRAWKS